MCILSCAFLLFHETRCRKQRTGETHKYIMYPNFVPNSTLCHSRQWQEYSRLIKSASVDPAVQLRKRVYHEVNAPIRFLRNAARGVFYTTSTARVPRTHARTNTHCDAELA